MAIEVQASSARLHHLADLLQRHVPEVQKPATRMQAADAATAPLKLAVNLARLLSAVKGQGTAAQDNATNSDPADGDRDADGTQASPQRKHSRRHGINQSRHLVRRSRMSRWRLHDYLVTPRTTWQGPTWDLLLTWGNISDAFCQPATSGNAHRTYQYSSSIM